jgi:hypothetical protein
MDVFANRDGKWVCVRSQFAKAQSGGGRDGFEAAMAELRRTTALARPYTASTCAALTPKQVRAHLRRGISGYGKAQARVISWRDMTNARALSFATLDPYSLPVGKRPRGHMAKASIGTRSPSPYGKLNATRFGSPSNTHTLRN